MSTSSVRQALRSDHRVVVVEAPAGAGKTHEAVAAALDLGQQLPFGTEVLMLAHTNAAVQEFRSRAAGTGAKARALTLMSFAIELLSPYAAALGLPTPFRMDGPEAVPFSQLAPCFLELMGQAPTIAASIAAHYPVIFFDEHQDARTTQHQMLEALLDRGRGRIRILGDPMQAIYAFDDDDPMVDWTEVERLADHTDELDEHHRWRHAPALGEWIHGARLALAAGDRLPEATPTGVTIRRVTGLSDCPAGSHRPVPALSNALQRIINEAQGSLAVLTKTNRNALGLRRTVNGRLHIIEDAAIQSAFQALARALPHVGSPRELALEVVSLLAGTSTGMTANLVGRVDSRLGPEDIDLRRSGALEPFLELLASLYAEPTLPTWCSVVDSARRAPPRGVRIDLPQALVALGSLRPDNEEDGRAQLSAFVRRRRESERLPTLAVSTIHKAKGREFDHIVLAHCSATPFRDDAESRRLLYVAISRARESVTILASATDPSPLLPLSN